MSFPFGRAVFAMIVCAIVTGAVVFSRPALNRADLVLWVSVDQHAKMYRGDLLDRFGQQTGKSVQLDLIAPAGLDVRLLSQFMFSADRKTDDAAPDLVEVDIGSIGKYFRPPVDEVGFLPLNGYLQRSGWKNRILASRFEPWTRRGVIFGVPNDLHPCTITYRKDLFDQAGIDLSSVETWDKFRQLCLVYQQYWNRHGQQRWAMQLSSVSPDQLMVLLHQQHVQLVDTDLSVHLTDDCVVRTLCWYAAAVGGADRFGVDVSPTPGQGARDLLSGRIGAIITPDWMLAELRQYAPELSGKLRMIPLPRFTREDAPTASWGGTMIGITRTCRDPDSAWKLIESLYLDESALKIRQQTTGILPPIPQYWSSPVYHQPDPFFAGQKIDELYLKLADQLPSTRMTAYTTAAQLYLSMAMNHVVSWVKSHGSDGLDVECRAALRSAQDRVLDMIRFDGAGRN